MGSEWRRLSVSSLIDSQILAVGDGYRAKNEELGSSGLPFARAGNIDGGFHFADCDRYPESELARVGNKISQPGDVVFTSKGTVGRFAFVSERIPRFVFSPQLCYWRSLRTDVIDPRFLYFWMHSREFFEQYKGVAGQTDMAEYVSLTDQRRMHITLPPIEEQCRIAHILGTLDDKIELNRQMNKTLEEMARALFKSWFVDFDPVRAKMSGRWTRTTPLPGLPTPLFDLFPDHLVDSDLGEIPAGWEVVRADSLFSVGIGKTPPRKEGQWFSTSSSDLRWMSIKDLGQSCVFIASVSEYLTRDAQQRFRVRVIPDDTVVLSFKLTVGRVAITDGEMLSNEAIAHFVPMAEKHIPSSYLYCYLREYDYESLGSTSSIASAVNSESVRSIQILVPNREVLLAYDEAVSQQFRRIRACQRENANIESMGHMLLAELIGNS